MSSNNALPSLPPGPRYSRGRSRGLNRSLPRRRIEARRAQRARRPWPRGRAVRGAPRVAYSAAVQSRKAKATAGSTQIERAVIARTMTKARQPAVALGFGGGRRCARLDQRRRIPTREVRAGADTEQTLGHRRGGFPVDRVHKHDRRSFHQHLRLLEAEPGELTNGADRLDFILRRCIEHDCVKLST